MSNRFKKLCGGMGALTLPMIAKAWGFVILCVMVVVVAISICLLLKRLNDIPPIDRERQIGQSPMQSGDFWEWYTNHGQPSPPSFNYVQGVDPWPMTYESTHPLTNNGIVYDYFELVSVAPPKPHDVLICSKLGGEWTKLATVGEGTNVSGFTNEDFEVWSAGGAWNINATRACMQKYQSMFWTAKPK